MSSLFIIGRSRVNKIYLQATIVVFSSPTCLNVEQFSPKEGCWVLKYFLMIGSNQMKNIYDL